MIELIGKFFINIERLKNYCIKKYLKKQFKACGKNVYIGSGCTFTGKNISIGEDVSIGKNCCMSTTNGEIVIGNHVMFGPGVHIHGGNHKIHELGKFMKEIRKTENDYDGKVIIEDDVWIGANAIILKGVKIGGGSVVGAGSVVSKDIPEYSIYTGVSEPIIRDRFTAEEKMKHLELLTERGLI